MYLKHPSIQTDSWAYTGNICFKGGGGGTSTTVQKTDNSPWKQQKPYLTYGFKEAKSQYQSDKPQFYPDSTVTEFSPETQAALGIRTAQATDPGSLINLAGTETGRTLRGEYLQPDNPVYQGLLEGVTGQVRPGVDTAFASSGRFGSPLHSEALGRGITQGMLPYIAQERDRMSGAVAQAMPVSQYAPGLLESVGGEREALEREKLQENIDRFNFEQNVDAMKLGQYMNAITGNYGSSGVSEVSQPVYRNPLMQGLGTASTLASIGSAAFAPAGGGGFMTGK